MDDHFMFSPDDFRSTGDTKLYWTETQTDGVKVERYLSLKEIVTRRSEITRDAQDQCFQITKSAHSPRGGLPGNFIWWFPRMADRQLRRPQRLDPQTASLLQSSYPEQLPLLHSL